MWRSLLIRCAAIAVTALAGAASAQTFPERPVRIVAPGTGGSADFVARLIAQGLGPRLGQQVIVDNRPNGVAPVEIVVRAQPDGYTILLYGSTVWLMPLLNSHLSYDPIRDLAPLTLAVSSPNIVVVPLNLPVKSIPDLPTVAASGLPGYVSLAMSGMFAPAKTPADLISRLNSEIGQVLKTVDVRQKLLNTGVEPVGSSPQELAAIMKAEIERMGKVIKAAGITAD